MDPSRDRRRDLLGFLFLTVVLVPVLAVIVVGGFGFAIWVFQMFAGPPGPPGG
ncbi:MAG: periplasmic nitrate reductase, NapE protein [Gammaproteobacteria bacterium]|nr:periplasmic nitrate reductase, NapE protein [Gammaproteobacteria bacterium]